MDRLQQKNELFMKLGTLVGPLQRLVEHPDEYDEQEQARVIAQYFADYKALQASFQDFCEGEQGYRYGIQNMQFYQALQGIEIRQINGAKLEDILPTFVLSAQAAIATVPIPQTSVILEAGSPFTAYCKLKELCEADVSTSLVWLDPYLGSSIFHRFLTSVKKNVAITLVTEEPNPRAGVGNVARWNEFLDISRLFALERGNALYRLIVLPSLHDRWVVFDSKRIYALGGSAKDAANKDYFTITSVEASPENLGKIQSSTNAGTEYFGPATSIHR